jgi:hypothetical protein
MISLGKKMAFAAVGSALMVFGLVAVASASVAPGTKVTGTSSDVVFTGTIDSVPIKVTCTSFTDSGTVTKKDKTTMAVAAPSITGCTDDLGGTDTITTSGKWELKVNSAGTELSLVIPKDGAKFTSSVESGCTVTAAPTKAADVTGKYNKTKGTVTDTKAKIPTKGTGCTTAKDSDETATVTFSPNPGKIPPFAS